MKKLAIALVLLATAAQAEQTAGPDEKSEVPRNLYSPCAQEQLSLYTTHTYNGYGMDDAQARYDADKKRNEELAASVGAKLKFSNESYSISPMNYDAPNERDLYNFSGNMSYEVMPASKGRELFRKLSAAGINASLNYSKNSND